MACQRSKRSINLFRQTVVEDCIFLDSYYYCTATITSYGYLYFVSPTFRHIQMNSSKIIVVSSRYPSTLFGGNYPHSHPLPSLMLRQPNGTYFPFFIPLFSLEISTFLINFLCFIIIIIEEQILIINYFNYKLFYFLINLINLIIFQELDLIILRIL